MLWSESLINKTNIYMKIDFSGYLYDINAIFEDRWDDHVQKTVERYEIPKELCLSYPAIIYILDYSIQNHQNKLAFDFAYIFISRLFNPKDQE